jgi:nitrite reductase/ring-hydroxylating ferredoxin subunit
MQVTRASLETEACTTSRSESADAAGREVALGPATVLAQRKRSVMTVDELTLLVTFHRRRFTVVQNRCPHRGTKLDRTRTFRRSLTCPRHSYRYSLVDGALRSAPRCLGRLHGRLTIYSTRVVDGWLYARIREGSAK